MQATVFNDASKEQEWIQQILEVRAEWLGRCLWSRVLSAEAMNSIEWERKCEWCKAQTGQRLANAHGDQTDEHLQSRFEWDAELGGGSK